MDEDELAVLQRSNVKTKADYDTFGDTAAELAQRAAAADAQARPSAIPGAIFQDLIAPVPDSVGEMKTKDLCTSFCQPQPTDHLCQRMARATALHASTVPQCHAMDSCLTL